MFKYLDKIYVINLDKHTERWNNIQQELKKFNIENYERFPGIIFNNGETLKDRERGCALSHFSIIQDAKYNKYKNILIFEDDTIIDSRIYSIEKDIESFILNTNFHLFYLGGNHLTFPSKITNCIGQVKKTYTTHSYIINESIYDLILDCYNKDLQIDVTYADIIQPLNKSYCTIPRVTKQKEGISYIQGILRNYDIVLADK